MREDLFVSHAEDVAAVSQLPYFDQYVTLDAEQIDQILYFPSQMY